jgi:hypothetical protein
VKRAHPISKPTDKSVSEFMVLVSSRVVLAVRLSFGDIFLSLYYRDCSCSPGGERLIVLRYVVLGDKMFGKEELASMEVGGENLKCD